MKKTPKNKTYDIKTLELWSTQGIYRVEAASPQEALRLVESGNVECLDHEHDGNDDSLLWASVDGKEYSGPGRVMYYALQTDGPMGPSYAGPFYSAERLLRETLPQLDPGDGTIFQLEININGKLNVFPIDESEFVEVKDD